jgi:hypothetical protein
MDQLGAVAGKQYQGDGLSVSATADGARLRCAFQRLEGQVTREGLWLSSTADGSPGDRFRVRAINVGRVVSGAPGEDFGFDFINPLTPSLSPSDGERVAEGRVWGSRLSSGNYLGDHSRFMKSFLWCNRPAATGKYRV